MNEHSFTRAEMQDLTPITGDSQAGQRISAILDTIRQTFVEKGFDGASMQDLARAASMSVGNFYRYFPSKNAIVAALVERDMRDLQESFEMICQSEDPAEALVAAFDQRIGSEVEHGDCALWTEIDAAANRKPEIAEMVRRLEAEVQHFLGAIFARIRQEDPPVPTARDAAMAEFVILLFKGATQRLARTGCDLSPESLISLRAQILATVRQILSDVSKPAYPGDE